MQGSAAAKRPASRTAIAAGLGALALALAAPAAAAADGRPAPIPPEVHAARRAALLERLGGETTLRFCSGRASFAEHDVDFRVDSDFYYLTGIDEPGIAIEIGPGVDALLLRRRNPIAERWEGPSLSLERARGGTFGFKEVRPLEGEAGAPGAPVREALAAMRLVKDRHEIARLRRAAGVTALALAEAARSIEPGMAEYEVEALIRYVFKREGAARAGFPPIVGSGPNSCVLHYMRNSRTMEAGDLVLCDVGAEYGRYTADVTRTFPVGGKFTPEQRRIYEAVLRAQEAAIEAVRPGATVGEVHRAALAALDRAGLAGHFAHGTSHWLGLDVHDAGDHDTPFEPGMVLTVEPGAYLAERAIGIRIEDDVLVTEWGAEVLSAAAPRRPDEIEALMAERGLGNVPIRPLPAAPRPAGTF